MHLSCTYSVAHWTRSVVLVVKFDLYHTSHNISCKSGRWCVKFLHYSIVASILMSYTFCKRKKVHLLPGIKQCLIKHSKIHWKNINVYSLSTFRSNSKTGTSDISKAAITPNLYRRWVEIMLRSSVMLQNVWLLQAYRRDVHTAAFKRNQKRSKLVSCICNVALCKNCFAAVHGKNYECSVLFCCLLYSVISVVLFRWWIGTLFMTVSHISLFLCVIFINRRCFKL